MTPLSLLPLLLLSAAAATAAAATRPQTGPGGIPVPAILNAPFTPFHAGNFSVNTAPIPALARNAAAHGVNVVWAGGGMGQFETMTVAERTEVFQAWVREGKANGIYVIAHVGTNIRADAVALARAAAEAGADAIASVPEYYEATGSVQAVVDWLAPIAAAAPSLPFFYYHIPGETRTNIAMADFLRVAPAQIPTLAGVKYVSQDPADFLNCTTTLGGRFAMLWAPEPKLTSLALDSQGAVLAEDFYAQTYIKMSAAFASGDMAGARREQMWKESVMAVFRRYGGGFAERYVYPEWAGVDLGPPRPPGLPLAQSSVDSMLSELKALDFFHHDNVEQV